MGLQAVAEESESKPGGARSLRRAFEKLAADWSIAVVGGGLAGLAPGDGEMVFTVAVLV